MAIKKVVEISAIAAAKKFLEKAPAKEPSTLPLMKALERLKPEIEAALKRGYSREEVIKLMADKGLVIKESNLKALFRKPQKNPVEKKK